MLLYNVRTSYISIQFTCPGMAQTRMRDSTFPFQDSPGHAGTGGDLSETMPNRHH